MILTDQDLSLEEGREEEVGLVEETNRWICGRKNRFDRKSNIVINGSIIFKMGNYEPKPSQRLIP